jgi:membrane associated rhomboid family serine protease
MTGRTILLSDFSSRSVRSATALRRPLSFVSLSSSSMQPSSRQAFSFDWLTAGEAQTGLIMSGEWWRALTALTLHADVEHLLGNIGMGCLLGLFVSQVLGAGLAWLAILLAGGIGNGLNALVHPAAHTSIGASTAVFAALGIPTVLALTRQQSPWTRGLRRWLPLVGGVTLLFFLGLGGERTDVGAHFAGFFVGSLFGLGLSASGTRVPQGIQAQYAFGAIAIGLSVLAWVLAFALAPQS